MPELRPIGTIRTPFAAKDDAPIQGAFRPEVTGTVEVDPEFAAGLADIDGFSHLVLLYEFDRAAPVEMVRQTFLGDEVHGLFATRHPARPNAIGMTVVTLISRDGTTLTVGGIDVLDETPLLDIKPYIPRFDSFPDASEGWLEGRPERPKPPGRE
ncbi:MAG: tRNA (N6-threonylcarbamoyladenosine(37)-N6)-methyltransferase TrmO [Coriobacteriia bacterium]|nr:tRNA (N6-threonylcarbamoyladenosine(37)-N6)-methyltransferase TrmO [Coriobacteriia bacterium]